MLPPPTAPPPQQPRLEVASGASSHGILIRVVGLGLGLGLG
jgi:hypothetical protein